jgi:hypothetical protein
VPSLAEQLALKSGPFRERSWQSLAAFATLLAIGTFRQ